MSVINTILTLISIWIAIRSLQIAEKAFNDAEKSSPKQQAALESSRKALESVVQLSKDEKLVLESSRVALELVVKSSNKQQDIINQGLIVSSEQLATIKKQWEEQQERFNQKPRFDIMIGDLTEQSMKNHKVRIKIDNDRWALVPLTIKNAGTVSAYKTTVFCTAKPDNVRLSDFKGFNPGDQNVIYPNIFTYRGFLETHIPPFNTINLPYLFYCYALIPEGVNAFSVSFKIYASNAKARTIEVDLIIQ